MLAHRWQVAVPASAGVALIGWVTRRMVVHFPVVAEAVQARLLVVVAAVLVALIPLYASFPALEGTLLREGRLRALRVLAAVALALVAVLPAWLAMTSLRQGSVDAEVRLLLVLLSVGLVAIVWVGDLAWAVGLSTGLVSIFADTQVNRPVSTALLAVPVAVFVVLLVVAGALVVRNGPRGH